jgi:hypothetical protein
MHVWVESERGRRAGPHALRGVVVHDADDCDRRIVSSDVTIELEVRITSEEALIIPEEVLITLEGY